jgi:hypothetical protein
LTKDLEDANNRIKELEEKKDDKWK